MRQGQANERLSPESTQISSILMSWSGTHHLVTPKFKGTENFNLKLEENCILVNHSTIHATPGPAFHSAREMLRPRHPPPLPR